MKRPMISSAVRRRFLRCATGLLLSVLCLLQGCLQLPNDRPDPNESAPVSGTDYLYLTMNYSYQTDITPALDAILTGMSGQYLLLANKTHSLEQSYAPDRIVTLTCATNGGKTVELEERTAQALYAMLAEMAADDVTDIAVTSGFRTYEYQTMLFHVYIGNEMASISKEAYACLGEDYIQTTYLNQGKKGLSRADAERVVLSYSASPGTSEHQTGLCVDFVTSTAGLDRSFEETPAFAWLAQNAYRFGFILRYPESKIECTGYSYEPWHYRFVGREAATEIALRGLCLEEFLGG